MFRRKQNQLVTVRTLGAESDNHDDSSQVNTVQSSSSRGIWHGRRLKAKMTPERRSKSLEGNLDNIDLVTVADQDKRKSQYSSQPHSLDINTDHIKDNPERNTLHVSPVQGRRLQIRTTPPSSFPPSHPSTTSTAAKSTVATQVKVYMSREPQPKQRIVDHSITAIPVSGCDATSMKTQQEHRSTVDTTNVKSVENVDQMKFGDLRMPPSTRAQCHLPYQNVSAHDQGKLTSTMQARPSSKLPTTTNYHEPRDEQFRDRTDTANSIKFDISYDL